MAASVLDCTRHLKVLVAHRPGFVQPVVLARMAATMDHLTGGGRIAIHFITGGDEADQRREGDFVPHDARYRRTGEVMSIAPSHLVRGRALRLRGRVLPLRRGVQLGQAGLPGRHPSLLRRRLAAGHRRRSSPSRCLRLLGGATRRGGRPDGDHRTGGGGGRTDAPLQHLPPPHHRRHRGRRHGRRRNGSPRRRRRGSTWPKSGWPVTRRLIPAWVEPKTPPSRWTATPGAPPRSVASGSSRCPPAGMSTTSGCG